MAKLIILGTANAIANEEHENTHMAIVGESGVVLVDCVGSPTVRLRQAGIELDQISDLIVTHFHPDHISAVPLLLMNMWLLGRQQPLRVYGLHHCLERLDVLLGSFQWENWPNFFPVSFHRLPERAEVLVLEREDVRIFSSPVKHMVPTIGLRFESRHMDRSIAYSCDTEPCQAVVELASGADYLIHEASGEGLGHSSAAQAGEIAQEAEIGTLYLIHYPVNGNEPKQLIKEARATFSGNVELAEDFLVIDL